MTQEITIFDQKVREAVLDLALEYVVDTGDVVIRVT